jgi:hypothetical protein
LERLGTLPDRVALRELEELTPDSFRFVLGADEELIDSYRLLRALERDVARRRALELSDEDRLALEHGERARIGSAVEVRQTEEDGFVGLLKRTDVGLAVRQLWFGR